MTYWLCDFYGAYIKPVVNVVNLQRESQRQTHRQRETYRERERKTDRQRQKERERLYCKYFKQHNKTVVKYYTDLL